MATRVCVLDGGGPKDSGNTLNSFLTKCGENVFWQIGPDMKELSTRIPNLVLTQKWWPAPRWLLPRTLHIVLMMHFLLSKAMLKWNQGRNIVLPVGGEDWCCNVWIDWAISFHQDEDEKLVDDVEPNENRPHAHHKRHQERPDEGTWKWKKRIWFDYVLIDYSTHCIKVILNSTIAISSG